MTDVARTLHGHDWRSRQPAWQGDDGLPMARGRYTIRPRGNAWFIDGYDGGLVVSLSEARTIIDELHADDVARLPVSKIYFIGERATIGSAVKIGLTMHPQKRLNVLQTGYPRTLNMLALRDGDKSDELIYHARYSERRLRGEWFEIDAAILREIDRLSVKD